MTSQRKAIVYCNVRQFTEQGHESLRIGDTTNASKHFSHALEKAELYGDEFLIRACSFNLGSCLVACGEPSRGLIYLTRAVPPDDQSDGLQNLADLEYNIGIAKHAVGDVVNATLSYEKAVAAYKELDNLPLQVEALSKLAVCFKSLKKLEEAAETLKKVADLHGELADKENQAIALSQLTMILAELKDMEECSKSLSTLLEVCHELDNPKLKGKIYLDIGLLYSSECCYQSASECFEHAYHALDDVPREDKDRMLEAVVLLNMGAALNHLQLYERAITFHNMAVKKFGEVGDKRSQSQVYCNLAFAHSKAEEYSDAKTAFEKAIECCRECQDSMEECLATEGLAAIYFRENDYDKAIKYYKEALAILTKSEGNVSSFHGERIVNKLAEAVEYQLKLKKSKLERAGTLPGSDNKRYGKRRGKPRYGKHNSLVAKGLEESYDELERISSSYENSSQSEDETRSDYSGSYQREGHKKSINEQPSSEELVENYNSLNERFPNRGVYRQDKRPYSYGNVDLIDNGERQEPSKGDYRKRNVKNSVTCVIQ